jgi:hypothetical protein
MGQIVPETSVSSGSDEGDRCGPRNVVIFSHLTPLIAQEDFVKKVQGKRHICITSLIEPREIIKLLFRYFLFMGYVLKANKA